MKFKIDDYVKVVRLPNSKLDYQGWTDESYLDIFKGHLNKITKIIDSRDNNQIYGNFYTIYSPYCNIPEACLRLATKKEIKKAFFCTEVEEGMEVIMNSLDLKNIAVATSNREEFFNILDFFDKNGISTEALRKCESIKNLPDSFREQYVAYYDINNYIDSWGILSLEIEHKKLLKYSDLKLKKIKLYKPKWKEIDWDY